MRWALAAVSFPVAVALLLFIGQASKPPRSLQDIPLALLGDLTQCEFPLPLVAFPLRARTRGIPLLFRAWGSSRHATPSHHFNVHNWFVDVTMQPMSYQRPSKQIMPSRKFEWQVCEGRISSLRTDTWALSIHTRPSFRNPLNPTTIGRPS